jgi:hypothetical protein
VSDKRLLGKCGNGESFLAETETFQTLLRKGTQEKPKFERDLLEYQSSGNQLRENPEFFQDWVIRQKTDQLRLVRYTAQQGMGKTRKS